MNGLSDHYAFERRARDDFIRETIGVGNIIDSFVVDNNHIGGAEIHSVTDTGIVIIRNQKTNILITEIIARPEQLRRLYGLRGETPPKWLMKRSYANNRHRYNER